MKCFCQVTGDTRTKVCRKWVGRERGERTRVKIDREIIR